MNMLTTISGVDPELVDGDGGNRPIQAKCNASVTNCGIGLEKLWRPLAVSRG